MPVSEPATNHEAPSVVSDQTGAAPGIEASAKISEHSRNSEGFAPGADSVEWGRWWRQRLEAGIEAAMQLCRKGGHDAPSPGESASQKVREPGPGTRNDHVERARRALSELLSESVEDAGFALSNSDLSPPAFTVLSDRMNSLQKAFESLRENVRIALSKADRSNEIIDSLEAENRGLKQRESERRQEPLIKGIISLFDDLRAVARHARTQAASNDAEKPELLESLMVFERQALEILQRNQVEAFEPVIADRFDATKQEAWETLEADSEDQDMQIAEVLRIGFEFAGRIIRPAAVKVYRFRDNTLKGEIIHEY